MVSWLQIMVLAALKTSGSPMTPKGVREVMQTVSGRVPPAFQIRVVLKRLAEKGYTEAMGTDPETWRLTDSDTTNS